MADMPRRNPPVPGTALIGRPRSVLLPRLLWMSASLCAASAWSMPSPAHAQSPGADDGGAMARIEAHAGLSGLRGSVAGMFGGAVLVGLGGRTWLGGAGYASAQVEYMVPGRGTSQVRMGYGGLTVEFEVADRSEGTWSAAALAGGGNADASDPLVGVEIGSDNFFVVQSVVRLRRPLRGPFGFAGEVGYRRAFGVQDIPGVDNGSLSGVTASVSIYALRR